MSPSLDDQVSLAWETGDGRCAFCRRLLRRDLHGCERPAGWAAETAAGARLRIVCWACHVLRGEMSDQEWRDTLQDVYQGKSPVWRNRRLHRRH